MSTIRKFDYSVDVLRSILWQYDSAPNLVSILKDKQQWYDVNQRDFWEKWFNNVFWLYNPRPPSDPLAFNTFGASVWSIILQIPLHVGLPPDPQGTMIFEFDNSENFDNGSFTGGGGSVALDIEDSALLLKLRYYQLVTNGCLATMPPTETNPQPVLGISDFVTYVFKTYKKYNGTVYVQDGLDMTMTYVFSSALPAGLKYILDNYDILPRPACVKLKTIIATDQVLQFDNPENFDNGEFVHEL